MEELKRSGIKFVGITLEKIDYKIIKGNNEARDLHIEYFSKDSISPDEKNLGVELTVQINKSKEKTAPFTLEAILSGFFEKQGEETSLSLKDFSKVNALALMFPFVREVVFNITSRSLQFPPLILEPVNIAALANKQSATKE